MNSLEFKYPFNAVYILVPIICLIIFILGYRKKEKILSQLKLNIPMKFKLIRILLASLGLGLIIFSLLGPMTLKGFTEVNRNGLDVYILLDTSKSMLVEDIKPNRISRAQKIIENIIDNLNGDRIGFIPYSSAAYIQMPLTDDYDLARMFLKVVDTDMIGGGGSNVGTAIKLSNESFDRTSSADKVVIVLSDGEEYDSDSLATLEKIDDENIKVFTIGIGSQKGGLIPIYDAMGEKIVEYKKDETGQFVTSKLNEQLLKNLASSGSGAYYQSTIAGDEINLLIKNITELKRDTFKTEKIKDYKQLYQYFLGVGIVLVLLAYFFPEGRKA